jgi:renalase
MTEDWIIVGAGIAGLTLARELTRGGRRAIVLERARGVGGRCATRRVEGQPVDHGVAFLHGRSPRFLAELEAVEGETAILDWPRVRDGEGLPCQPEAFAVGEARRAFGAGVNRFARHLARGLDVRLETNVAALAPQRLESGAAGSRVVAESGATLEARGVALALPLPSALRLLATLAPLPGAIATVLPLLELPHTLPCLTVIARYPAGAAAPAWEASYPRRGGVQAVFHDSSKRPGGARLVLVIQARAAWSRARLERPAAEWARELLDEAAAASGAWIAAPEHVEPHAWRHARVDAGSALAAPLLLELDGGARLGLAGDAFHAAGGLEGAHFSGVELARRIIEGA